MKNLNDCLSLLKRILQGQVQDIRIPKEQIGEEKEYKWRSSSKNHEPILINNETGKMVSGVGMEARESSATKPAKIDVTYTSNCCPNGANVSKKQQIFWKTFADRLNKNVQDSNVSDEALARLYQNLNQNVTVGKMIIADVGRSEIAHHGTTITSLKATDLNKYPSSLGTTLHELAHCIDVTVNTASMQHLTDSLNAAYKQSGANAHGEERFKGIPAEIKNGLAQASAKAREQTGKVVAEIEKLNSDYNKTMMGIPYYEHQKRVELQTQYNERYKQYKKEWKTTSVKAMSESQGWDAVSDIIDAITYGQATCKSVNGKSLTIWGHGPTCFSSEKNRAMEVWANYCDLAMQHPEKIKMLKKYYPDIIKACETMSKEVERQWKK